MWAVNYSVRFGKAQEIACQRLEEDLLKSGGVTVDIKGKEIHYKGKRSSGRLCP